MTDKELGALLKSVQAPTERESFRDNLPGDVLRAVGRPVTLVDRSFAEIGPGSTLARCFRTARAGLGIAGVCMGLLVLMFAPDRALRITDTQLAEARKYYNEIKLLFPNQLRGIALKDRNPALLLSDQPDLPDSEPVLLRVSGPSGQGSFVVLNGQEFTFDGNRYEVLLDHRGDVLVIGPGTAWSSLEPNTQPQRLKIAARILEST